MTTEDVPMGQSARRCACGLPRDTEVHPASEVGGPAHLYSDRSNTGMYVVGRFKPKGDNRG